jgi:uncharacterized protein (DUF58 family)
VHLSYVFDAPIDKVQLGFHAMSATNNTSSQTSLASKPSWFSQRLDRFFAKRQPRAEQVQLRQKTLLILPSRFGMAMLMLVILLYVLGSNYQNNLIILLSFFLLSLIMGSCWFSFRQLHGVTLSAGPTIRGFADEALTGYIVLDQGAVRRLGISLTCDGQHINLEAYEALRVESSAPPNRSHLLPPLQIPLQFPASSRGLYSLSKIIIASHAPFGLVRCWSQVELQQQIWRYPARRSPTRRAEAQSQDADVPDQIQAYTAGAPLKQMVWKRLAQMPDRPLVRVFSGEQQPHDDLWLSVDAPQGPEREQQLSQLCELIGSMPNEQRFGLRTPSHELPVSHGQHHQQRALEYLSLCP